ncbi:MAG: phenylalanine--tRNA ligase beta subunit-related protein, partial [Bryobacteraceae bacterium]
TIFIRPARAGERLVALNDIEYDLGPSNLVIADASGAVAVAGVIGGRATAIDGSTRSIVLESACFQAASIRKTSVHLKLRTDASMRFEKSQDPENTVRALARAMELLEELSPGIRVVGGVSDCRGPVPDRAPIALRLDWLARKLGRGVEAAEVRTILERLGFGVADAPGGFAVTTPSWRATRDVSIKEDLLEEVGRMIGYDSIPPRAPLLPAAVVPEDPQRVFPRTLRRSLAARGFTEVYNYSFVSEEQARAFGLDPPAHIAVTNPISSEQGLLRLSLLPGIRKNVEDNRRHFDSFRLFEIGHEIHPGPREIPHLAALVYARDDGAAGLYELKGIAEGLMPGATAAPAAAESWEHPARAAAVE